MIAPAVIGAAVLAVTLILHWENRLGPTMLWGFLLGLMGGFLSALFLTMADRSPKRKTALRMLAGAVGPFGAVALLAVSPGLGAGYFAGAGVAFSFCTATSAARVFLLNRPQDNRNGGDS